MRLFTLTVAAALTIYIHNFIHYHIKYIKRLFDTTCSSLSMSYGYIYLFLFICVFETYNIQNVIFCIAI